MKKIYSTPTTSVFKIETVSMIAATTLTIDGSNASVESTYLDDGYDGEFCSRGSNGWDD